MVHWHLTCPSLLKVKAEVAKFEKLDTLIWYYEELQCPEVDNTIALVWAPRIYQIILDIHIRSPLQRLSNGEEPLVRYKEDTQQMHCHPRNINLIFYQLRQVDGKIAVLQNVWGTIL